MIVEDVLSDNQILLAAMNILLSNTISRFEDTTLVQ